MLGQRLDDVHVADAVGHRQRVHVRVEVALRPGLRVEVHIQDAAALLREVFAEERERLLPVNELHLQLLERVHMDDLLHHPQDDEHDHARHERHDDEAGAHRQADARRAPQRGRRRQAGDLVLGHEDRARAQEAHAGDDRRGDAADAHVDRRAAAQGQHRRHSLLLDERNQRRAHAHQHVRAHARRTILDLTVDADHGADEHRRADAQRMAEPLHAAQQAQESFHPGNLLLAFLQICQQ